MLAVCSFTKPSAPTSTAMSRIGWVIDLSERWAGVKKRRQQRGLHAMEAAESAQLDEAAAARGDLLRVGRSLCVHQGQPLPRARARGA